MQAMFFQGLHLDHVLHANLRCNTGEARQTVEKIEEMGWELSPHPQYSPGLASNDFHLSGGDHSRNRLEALSLRTIQQHVRKFLHDANKDFSATGFS